ncbi:uncharacterized protein ISCGN_023264 [Ixodes scapularis]
MEGGLKTPRPLDLSSQSPDVWDDWLQSYKWYATAIQLQKKPPEVQVANFMTVIGPDAQNVFRTLPLSEDDKKNLDIVKQRFKEHFHPKVNHAYERYRFNQMKQKEGETFNEFLTAARLQAKKCKFGELTDELLRDRIIVGITNDDVRERLLSDPTVDLQKAVNLCKASEQASQQLKEIANKETKTVDAVTKKTKQLPRKKTVAETKEQAPANSGMARKACSFCGGFHRPKECPAYGKTCNKCQKKGHFAAVCRSSRSMVQHKVHAIDNHEDPEEEMYVSELRTKTSKTVCQEEIQFKCGTKVVMKLDTGAQCNVLPNKNVQAMRLQVFPSPVKRIATYSNHKMQVIGEYLQKFVPNLADKTAPLRKLITKDTEYLWTEEQSKALTEIKQALKSAPTLAYYNAIKSKFGKKTGDRFLEQSYAFRKNLGL